MNSNIHTAIRTHNKQMAAEILSNPDYDVNVVNDLKTPAFHAALERNGSEIARMIMNHPSFDHQTINRGDLSQEDCFGAACSSGYYGIALELLHKFPDKTNGILNCEQTILEIIFIESGKKGLAHAGSETESLYKLIKAIFANPVFDPNLCSDDSLSPLMGLLSQTSCDLKSRLIDLFLADPRVDFSFVPKNGRHGLFRLASNGSYEDLVKVHKRLPDFSVDKWNKTPLSLALESNLLRDEKETIIRFLVEKYQVDLSYLQDGESYMDRYPEFSGLLRELALAKPAQEQTSSPVEEEEKAPATSLLSWFWPF